MKTSAVFGICLVILQCTSLIPAQERDCSKVTCGKTDCPRGVAEKREGHCCEECDGIHHGNLTACDLNLTNFYFDAKSGACSEFLFHGCGGNDNNFITQSECERTCGNSIIEPEAEDCRKINGYCLTANETCLSDDETEPLCCPDRPCCRLT